MGARWRHENLLSPSPQSAQLDQNGNVVYGFGSMNVGKTRTTNDVVTPRFHSRKAKGEIIMNNYLSQSTEVIDLGGGGYTFSNIPLGGNQEFYCSPGAHIGYLIALGYSSDPRFPGLIDSVTLERMRNEASTKVHAQRGQSDSNLWESLAEWRQTVSMIRKPLSAFNSFYSSMFNSRGQLRRKITARNVAKGAAGSAANGWLQLQYGVKPLVKDIQMITSGFAKKVERRRQTTRAFESMTRSKTTESKATFGVLTTSVTETVSDSVEIRAMSIDEHAVSMANNIGLTAKGLLQTPWELIPYSFVVDWFANIGDFIGANLPDIAIAQLGGCLVEKRTIDGYIMIGTTTISNGWVLLQSPSGGVSVRQQTRSRGPLPAPGLTFRAGSALNSDSRVASAASLVTQQVLAVFNSNNFGAVGGSATVGRGNRSRS